ncbi:MAG: hypothetical protein LBV08_01385 [Clostridiales bacterium]|jgi:hypothetical protein|nr:hypothetical protein [Clostridiales bacterium]
MLKRVISIVLSAIFILPNINLTTLFAAGASFKIEDAYNLSEGKNNVIPILNNSVSFDKNNSKTISWDLNQIDGAPTNSSQYELSYYASDKVKMVLKLNKTDNNNAIVDISFLHDTDPGYMSSIEGTYRIYSNVGTTDDVKNYMAPDDFLAMQGSGLSSIPLATDHPLFNIQKSTGFSVLYNNNILHFLWDRGGKFFLTSENFLQGMVYNLNLDYGVNSLTGQDKLNVLTGISENSIHSIPTAIRTGAAPNTPQQSFYMDGDLQYLFDTGDININNGDNLPAVDTGFVLLFEPPKTLNPITHVYELYNGQALDFKVPLKLTLDNEINPKLEINLSDIMKQAAGEISIDTSVNCTLEKYGTRLALRFTGLPASSIYHLSKIEVISEGSNINKSTTNIDKPKIFTFLNFEPIYLNGRFYMQVFPYGGFEGNYLLKSGPNLNYSVSQYSDGKGPILFPLDNITLDTTSTTRYQIFFDPLKPFDHTSYDTEIYSQVMLFTPDLSKITVGIVNRFEIKDDYYLLPDPNVEGNQKSDFLFNALWDIGDVSLINKMLDLNGGSVQITYRLDKTTSIPSKAEDESNVTDITLDIYRVGADVMVKYSGDGVLNTEEVRLGTRYDVESDRTYYSADVKLSKEAYYKNSSLGSADDFKYPNIYFMNIRPINVNGNSIVVGPSLYESVTLNDITKIEVLPPQDLTAYGVTTKSVSSGDEKDEVSFKLSYDIPAAALKEYIEKNFRQPIDADDIEVNVNLYISQNESFLRNQFSNFSYQDRVSNSNSVVYQENIVVDSDGEEVSLVYFSGINGETPLDAPGFDEPIDILRGNLVARLGKVSLSKADIDDILNGSYTGTIPIKIDGLDKNQKYYVTSDLELKHNSGGVVSSKNSIVSNIVSALTIGDEEEVVETEKVPPAPILQKKDVLQDRATIFWDKIISSQSDGTEDIIEYEIIRLKDTLLDNIYLENRAEFEKFWGMLPDTEKLGFQTDGGKLYQYSGGSFSLAPGSEYLYEESVNQVFLTDMSLYPNNLYFYYVRAVRVIDGERVYSSWNNISVTTNPVEPPINLVISDSGVSYNPKSEFLIEFDAPIQDIAKLGVDFFLEYSLKEDDGEFGEPIRMDSRALSANSSKSTEEGYIHFIYKISGLTHGKNYIIKVRMVDKKGDASVYSNNAITRTNIDQEDYEDEKEKDDWVDYTQKELEKELKAPYWTAADNDSLLELIFRQDMFDGFIAPFPDSVVQLPSGAATDKIYYLPLSAIKLLEESKKGLRVADNDTEVVITAGFLEGAEGFSSILKQVENGEFQDLYVKLSVSFKPRAEVIEGNPTIGKVAIVSVEVIGLKELTKTIDKEIYENLAGLLKEETEKKSFSNKLEGYVSQGAYPEEMHQMVNSFISDAKSEFYKEVSDVVLDATDEKFRIVNLSSDIIIVQKNTGNYSGIKGYRKAESVWQTIDVYGYNGSKGIYTRQTGEYAFTGYELYIIGLDSMENQDKVKALIVKYELLDYFGKDGFSVDSYANKYMVSGSIARMTGARRGDDCIRHLQSKGITVANRNLYTAINIQDSLYLIMKAYEIKTNTKLESVRVTDFNSINKIPGIDSQNKLAVMVAWETKIYTDKSFNPDESLTIGGLLKTLLALEM